MKYTNYYDLIVKEVGKVLPKRIDDEYVQNRSKYEGETHSYTTEYSWSLCGQDLRKFDLSGLSLENFAKLSFDSNTIFTKEQLEKFKPYVLLEIGKQFGLQLDLLHQAGINGNNVNVAVIDSNYDINNEEMINTDGTSKVKLYDNHTLVGTELEYNDDFHGRAVTSLLCGSTVGVAPSASLYFFADNGRETTDILEKIKRFNENGENISIISMSSFLSDDSLNEQYTQLFETQNCAFLSSTNFLNDGYDYMNRNNYKDIDDPNNFSLENLADISDYTREKYDIEVANFENKFSELEQDIQDLYQKLEHSNIQKERDSIKAELEEKEKLMARKDEINRSYEDCCKMILEKRDSAKRGKLYIPCGGRTRPQIGGGYVYEGASSASWTIPQVAGLYILARQLDPMLSFGDFTQISKKTCHQIQQGYFVINPEGMVREVNERNRIKSQQNDNYKSIYGSSSVLIENLDRLINREKSFAQGLRANTVNIPDTSCLETRVMAKRQQDEIDK